MYSPMYNMTTELKASMLVCAMLVASFCVFAIATIPDSEASSSDYCFSGELMEVLSDSNGVNEKTVDSKWSYDSVRGYAVVGDFAYVSTTAGDLVKLELRSGQMVEKVSTGVGSGADYISVGGGFVLDPKSGKVFDLDLKQVYELGVTSDQAYYEDGCWFVVTADKTCHCFPAKDEDSKSSTNVQSELWSQNMYFYIDGFTLTVSLAFNDDYLFYPGIGESDSTLRILYCMDKETGAIVDNFDMSEIKGTYWNSGFIQCYDDTVIVTTHWDSMFTPPRLGPDYKTMFLIDVGSDGKFVTNSATYLSNGYNDSYGSCLVVSDGLGFAQTGLSFKVFDMKTGEIVASTDVDSRLGKTYSNIAVAAGDDGYVRGYVSPAGAPNPLSPVDGLICFEYNTKTKEIRSFDLTVGVTGTDNTNSIKIGPNGEVLFAKNDGKMYCIIPVVTEKSDMTLWIVLGVVAALIILAIVFYFIKSRKTSTTN